MAKKAGAATCPKCGGPKRGRGYSHTASCEDYNRRGAAGSGGKTRGGGKRGRRGGSPALRGMSLQELVSHREAVDNEIRERLRL